MRRQVRGLFLVLVCLLALPLSARGQDAASASLSALHTGHFPTVETYLDVRGPGGLFAHGLRAEHVRLLEDGQQVPLTSLAEIRPGVQMVLAINPGPVFAVRDGTGTSRYEYVLAGLSDWANRRQGTTIDDLNFVVPNGGELTHLENPGQWLGALQGLEFPAREFEPSLETLLRAIEIISGEPPRQGMGKVILYVTPPMEGQTSRPLEEIASRAKQMGVHITVWMITPPSAPLTEGGNRLVQLAAQTGGQFYRVSGPEDLPDPEVVLEPLRSVYHLTYESQARTNGEHALVAEIDREDLQLSSPAVQFELEILPPEPVFVSPPLEIERQPVDKEVSVEEIESGSIDYAPDTRLLQILVAFPDQKARPLRLSRLYVDDALVAENTAPPFDQFQWDLSEYRASGQHLLKVEVVDVLGLVGLSIDTLVQVNVEQPKVSFVAGLAKNIPQLAALAALIIASGVILVLILRGRIHPYASLKARQARRRPSPAHPIPLPKAEAVTRRMPNWFSRLQRRPRRGEPALAVLTPLPNGSLPTSTADPHTSLPVMMDETFFGCDPNQATFVLDDPSVEACHARLVRSGEGSFRLIDEGSIAGTWVNYEPLGDNGRVLNHGDLIHIGRAAFRFSLPHPPDAPKPALLPEDEKQEAQA